MEAATLPKRETMEFFSTFAEDFNTCTLPHEKYSSTSCYWHTADSTDPLPLCARFYNMEKWDAEQMVKRQRKAAKKAAKATSTMADEELKK